MYRIVQPEVIPGVEKFSDSFNGSFTSDAGAAQQKQSEDDKIQQKRIAELKKLNDQQLLAEIKALKERAYRYFQKTVFRFFQAKKQFFQIFMPILRLKV